MNGPRGGVRVGRRLPEQDGPVAEEARRDAPGEALVVVDVVTLSSSRLNGPSPRPAHGHREATSKQRHRFCAAMKPALSASSFAMKLPTVVASLPERDAENHP